MKGSLYSVSDKAMFDAINQSKVTNSELKDIFLSRGIIVSHETKREKLARYFSLFPHSYQDYKRLADILGANTRREKNTSTTVNRIVDKDVIETVAAGLVSDLEHFGATCTIEESEKNSISIKVEYREFNYSNSEFKQISNKEAVISIEINEENLIIRHPQNKTVEEWKSLYISKLESELEEEVETTNINLSNTTDHEVVTRFFNELINGIDGYKLYDVTDVYVYHPEEKHLDEDEDEDENDFENPELGTHISKASLKGQNVLRSEELLQLYKKGFYISKIVWRSKSEKLDDELYEFEAQFSDAENKDYFSYLVKGFYSYKGSGEYVKGRKSLTSIQERELTKKVETAAHNALKKVME
ncbi:hypothetical protein NB537_15030 [Vibrio parahaemolyticus]|nr:hypothetical protein [Vibrio parahaemolyticus]MCR9656096.1 hypothetical protein [Vibrio parahaemolyticus]